MKTCVFLAVFIASAALLADSQIIEPKPALCDPAHVHSSATITNDTKGVDFGPYLTLVKRSVKARWYSLVPESSFLKKGCVAIQFKILPDGRVAAMEYVSSSGDVGLDHAAWNGLMAADPFPPLPTEFKGDQLTLRFTFFYNLPLGATGGIETRADASGANRQSSVPSESALATDGQFVRAYSPKILPDVPILVPDTSPIRAGSLALKTEPKYPKEARKRKAQGTIVLEVTVEKNGAVDQISILSGDLVLADAAVDAVRSWAFEPYTQSGKPVQVRQKLVFNFNPESKIGELDPHLPSPIQGASVLEEIDKGDLAQHAAIYKLGPGMTPPRTIQAPDPEYSEAAKKSEISRNLPP